MKKMMYGLSAALLAAMLSAAPEFQPGVKEYVSLGGAAFDVSGLPVVHEKGESQTAAATEVPSSGERREFTGDDVKGSAVFIATAATEFGRSLASRFSLSVPEKPQGYAIVAKDGSVAIIGHDPVGAFYGAVTFRQMVEDGKVAPAKVRDWPDVLYRGNVSVGRALWRYTEGEKDRAAALKAAIDELARLKLNMVCDHYRINLNAPEDSIAWWREINRYAKPRGVYANDYPSTALYYRKNAPKGVTLDTWTCVKAHMPWEDSYFCWADDTATEAAAERYAEYLVKSGMDDGVLVIHPVDGGAGDLDPEFWSMRCAKCRARWGDGERWKASANQFDIWARVLRRRCPKAIVGSCINPYKFNALLMDSKLQTGKWRECFPEYWRNLDRALKDKDFFFSSWICGSAAMREIRKLVPSRQFHFSDTYPQTAGIFEAFHRKACTVYEPGSANMFSAQGSEILEGHWESLALISECTWNVKSPAAEPFDGAIYYDGYNDHSGDSAVFTEALPRICRAFWGRELAPHMADVMGSGIMPAYLQDPPRVVEFWNRTRRDPMFDPMTDGGGNTRATGAQKPIEDTMELMAAQVEAAKKCVAAMKAAMPSAKCLTGVKRRYFMSLAKNAPFWLATARARFVARRGQAMVAEGRNQEASNFLSKALDLVKADYAAAEDNLRSLAGEKDSRGFRYVWPYGKDKAVPDIENVLASARVTLRPRRIGRYVRVGVTSGPSGDRTKAFLDGFENVRAEMIDSLSLAELDRFDCVFVMDRQWAKDEFYNNLRAYANKGAGGVYLEGPLSGNVRFDTRPVFPEVVAASPKQVFNPSRKAKRMDGSDAKTMYVDYFTMTPGCRGEVVATAGDGTPFAVKGAAGHGKVFCVGLLNVEAIEDGNWALKESKDRLFGINAELAKAAVEYFSDVRLKSKDE